MKGNALRAVTCLLCLLLFLQDTSTPSWHVFQPAWPLQSSAPGSLFWHFLLQELCSLVSHYQTHTFLALSLEKIYPLLTLHLSPTEPNFFAPLCSKMMQKKVSVFTVFDSCISSSECPSTLLSSLLQKVSLVKVTVTTLQQVQCSVPVLFFSAPLLPSMWHCSLSTSCSLWLLGHHPLDFPHTSLSHDASCRSLSTAYLRAQTFSWITFTPQESLPMSWL